MKPMIHMNPMIHMILLNWIVMEGCTASLFPLPPYLAYVLLLSLSLLLRLLLSLLLRLLLLLFLRFLRLLPPVAAAHEELGYCI